MHATQPNTVRIVLNIFPIHFRKKVKKIKLKKITTAIISAALAVSALGAVTAFACPPEYSVGAKYSYNGIDFVRGYGSAQTSSGAWVVSGYIVTKTGGLVFAHGSASYMETNNIAYSSWRPGQGLFTFNYYDPFNNIQVAYGRGI